MTIAQVSKKYSLTHDTLRYYERAGLIPAVPRKNGIRDYDEESCRWIEFVKCMRLAGIPIEVINDYVALVGQGDSTAQARLNLLVNQRKVLQAKLADMQQTLQRLDTKISYYTDLQQSQSDK